MTLTREKYSVVILTPLGSDVASHWQCVGRPDFRMHLDQVVLIRCAFCGAESNPRGLSLTLFCFSEKLAMLISSMWSAVQNFRAGRFIHKACVWIGSQKSERSIVCLSKV